MSETENIKTFLNSKRTKNNFYTHQSMGRMKGVFNIEYTDMSEFWRLYQDHVYDKSEPLCILETKEDSSPIIGDIDLKVEKHKLKSSQIHTNIHIQNTVKIFQDVLVEVIDECTDKHLICVVLKRNSYEIKVNDKVYVKHGFHLHFPYCFLETKEQSRYIYPRARELLKEHKVFDDVPDANYDTIIDDVTKNAWLLYGSSKDESIPPYKYTSIFNSELKEISIMEAFKNYKIYDENEDLIEIEDMEDEYEYHLPRILSIHIWNRPVCDVKPNVSSRLSRSLSNQPERKSIENIKIKLNDLSRSLQNFSLTDIITKLNDFTCNLSNINFGN